MKNVRDYLPVDIFKPTVPIEIRQNFVTISLEVNYIFVTFIIEELVKKHYH
jgi:hypothetical protein